MHLINFIFIQPLFHIQWVKTHQMYRRTLFVFLFQYPAKGKNRCSQSILRCSIITNQDIVICFQHSTDSTILLSLVKCCMQFHPLVDAHTLTACNCTRIDQEWNPCLTKISQFWQTDKLITRLCYRLRSLKFSKKQKNKFFPPARY